MDGDLTVGNITGRLLKFAFPLMVGNVLQQFYNVADTLIVGRFLGTNALAAVGSSYGQQRLFCHSVRQKRLRQFKQRYFSFLCVNRRFYLDFKCVCFCLPAMDDSCIAGACGNP